MSQFKNYETLSQGQQIGLEDALRQLKFNEQELIPAIAQQHDTGEVLMLAWMNMASIRETLETGQICYWSRSRQSYWRKGESSGHVQKLVSMRFDCDGDAILLQVDQTGPACHTNRRNCFYLEVCDDQVVILTNPA
ncbi:phosphoribosyl-AMP cyclohydrolase [Gynuella sunshinyii]|uniref:Phosphoribosyl-AMP cyclohydrolase n=1 Tax=Gynuella sunshinyii YC6258 TaxID=1445510 RepID=A0A0C5VR86_9GAMM|nr:phosphoribosyl-AMP cyclohydrolase [Gynuella sunshinyii]AJQ95928.1 phosphoribosyl-AMP cyclohydrolase [Gynuella sunshinyii YC6258]